MLLPYASYLRVYEPAEQTASWGPGSAVGDPPIEAVATLTLAREQHAVLMRAIALSAPSAQDDLVGCFLMRHDSRLYICPVDLALRSWLALASFTDETDVTTQGLFFAADHTELAAGQLAAWRQLNPSAVPHIRMSTWGVPRTWFLLVEQSERELYDMDGTSSVRFRTSLTAAKRRLLSAYTLLSAMIDDVELLEELGELGRWLASFPADGRLELDYAGIAGLLGEELHGDRSAAEIRTALTAIEERDFAAAGDSYRHFAERWRGVNALERAN